jgi:hypothetical protein
MMLQDNDLLALYNPFARYAASLRLFTQIFIPFYSQCLCEYIEHVLVLNATVFINLYTIYYASTLL